MGNVGQQINYDSTVQSCSKVVQCDFAPYLQASLAWDGSSQPFFSSPSLHVCVRTHAHTCTHTLTLKHIHAHTHARTHCNFFIRNAFVAGGSRVEGDGASQEPLTSLHKVPPSPRKASCGSLMSAVGQSGRSICCRLQNRNVNWPQITRPDSSRATDMSSRQRLITST